MSEILHLVPRLLSGRFPVDVHTGHPEVGGFEVHIWQTAARDEGMAVHLPSLSALYRFFRDVDCNNRGGLK